MASIAVVGGGIVGVTASLLAARQGWQVTLFEAEPELWSRASAVNEGKIHLGPVFALGDDATVDLLQRGALSFAGLVDEAIGAPLCWPDLTTDTFDYLVMPDSLLCPSELAARYRVMNEGLSARGSHDYLGESLPYIVDPTVRTDERSGLPAFRTLERSVDPAILGPLLTDRLEAEPLITVRTGCRVRRVRPRDESLVMEVSWGEREGAIEHGQFDAVINAAWDQQQALLPDAERLPYNFRLKCAVRLQHRTPGAGTAGRGATDTPTVTLVQGPYGDVVTHRDYVYASWYPVARLTNEHGSTPSEGTYEMLRDLPSRSELIDGQLQPLRDLGLLPPDTTGLPPSVLVGGVIAGHGKLDIHARASKLHHRADFGPTHRGGMVMATNFKFTTAPLAARLAVDEVARRVA